MLELLSVPRGAFVLRSIEGHPDCDELCRAKRNFCACALLVFDFWPLLVLAFWPFGLLAFWPLLVLAFWP